jgi:glycosyltransferase involved in cell wall biosynthesis
MKILLATESYYPNIDGGAIAQHNLVNELKKREHEIFVVAPGYHFRNYIENDNGITVYRTRSVPLPFYMKGRYRFSPFPLLKIRNIIKKLKPDIIHICSPFQIGASAYLWARKYCLPVIDSIHILPENVLSPFFSSKYYNTIQDRFWRYLIYFYNLADWVTIPTQTGADIYKNKGLKNNITPISNGINTKLFNPNNDGEYLRKKFNLPKKNIVMYAGRITPEKNLDVLVKAIPHVTKKTESHFLFVGSGGEYKNYLEDLAKELNVSKNTTFTNFLDWKDYPKIYSIADVFALPAESELQSIVTLEAVATGLPVVVVNKGALPELANSGNGFIFEPKDNKEMAEQIINILTNKKLKKEMGKKSMKLIEKHSLKTVASEYETAYKNAIKVYNKKQSI